LSDSKENFNFIFIFLTFNLFPFNANAYIGPALGVGAIIGTIAVIFGLFILLFSIIYFPLKRKMKFLFKKDKKEKE
jgi:hypothetical protein